MKKKKIYLIISFALAVAIVISASLAWFVSNINRLADTNSLPVAEPPLLYILDSDSSDIVQINLQDLRIGEEKEIVFCISSLYPANPNNSGYKGSFYLELAYTNNLKADFSLRNAELLDAKPDDMTNVIDTYSQKGVHLYFERGDLLSSTDESEKGNSESYEIANYSEVQAMNQATYKNFQTSSVETSPNFALRFNETHLSVRYFVLDITWKNGTNGVDAKETDLVYIMARGGYSE